MEVNKHINFLKRRGLLIKESSQLTLDLPVEDTLNFKLLCSQGSDVFCKLLKLAEEHGIKDDPKLSKKLVDSITKIYKYLKPPIKNNRSKFNRLILVILNQKLENAINTFDIIADVIDDVNVGDLRKSISQLTDEDIELGDDVLLKIINDIKYQSYTKYENSFIGDHFESYRTKLELSYKGDDVLNQKFSELLIKVIQNELTVESLSLMLYNGIISNFSYGIGKFIKADLKCKKPLTNERGHIIIRTDDYVEVKMLDYKADSYLSEFFAIYKNPEKLPDILKTDSGLNLYNNVIDSLYLKLNKEGQEILSTIYHSFAGIIYDENRFIPREYIKLYWSNKGQRIDDHRLSIRYKVKDNNFIGYVYNPGNDVLTTQEISTEIPKQDVLLPLTVNESINEDTVSDKGGKDWGRYSPQGKMIRTKGGTVPLDTEFDWARQHIGDIPDDIHIEALINALGSSNVIGPRFEEEKSWAKHWGLRTFNLQNGQQWAVGNQREINDAKYDYVNDWVSQLDWLHEIDGVEDYLDLPYSWIRDYAENEVSEIVHDMDTGDLIDEWTFREKKNKRYPYYTNQIKDMEKFKQDLEDEVDDIDDEILRLNNRISEMEANNQDYLSYGYEEPQFTEEDFENVVNRIEELESEKYTMEKNLENEVDTRWDELTDNMRWDLKDEFSQEMIEEIESDPIQYFINKGIGSTPVHVISQLDLEDYLDKERYVVDAVEHTTLGSLASYGEYKETEVNGTPYTVLRVG